MENETGVQKPKGIMRSKLVMSFYRAAKPPSSLPLQYSGGGGGDHKGVAAVVKPSHPHTQTHTSVAEASTQRVISFQKQRSFGRSDGYVHGPEGGAGDRGVDNKASSYISYVKERRMHEEFVATHGFISTPAK